jgi:molybdopterin/thiamine biosynthesis adenylyltransferase
MELERAKTIIETIKALPFVSIHKEFLLLDSSLRGRISVHFEPLEDPLEFDVFIQAKYPYRDYESESIKFVNEEYLAYAHVMENGVVCIHTSHEVDLKKKLIIDFYALKDWIEIYYIHKKKNIHYEHLIVPQCMYKEELFAFMFTEVDYRFTKNQYGFVNLALLNKGSIKGRNVNNYITQQFLDPKGNVLALCEWSLFYITIPPTHHGLFLFVEHPPAVHHRFIFRDWSNFEAIFEQEFLEFLHHCEQDYITQKKQKKDQPIPLYIGYRISDQEIHWQIALLDIGNFPIEGVKEDKKWSTALTEGEIAWGISRNTSYNYFFGRGAFSENITNKKILIIGTGAIGSIVAETLTRGGCKRIDLSDHDIKEPGNVCRSAFHFAIGITEKVKELSHLLSHISPFVEIRGVNQSYFELLSKDLFKDSKAKEELTQFLNGYDLIFDCSTDNDLMYTLNQLELKSDLINLSITNHAQELVCAFYPNVYHFVMSQFTEVLKQDTVDIYNPTGCWSPTFKASYYDISVLVHYALKHINQLYEGNLSKNNFVIETGSEGQYTPILKEF